MRNTLLRIRSDDRRAPEKSFGENCAISLRHAPEEGRTIQNNGEPGTEPEQIGLQLKRFKRIFLN